MIYDSKAVVSFVPLFALCLVMHDLTCSAISCILAFHHCMDAAKKSPEKPKEGETNLDILLQSLKPILNTEESAKVLVEAVRKQILPSQILTRKAFENAISVIMAVGGSTNAVLHLLAISRTIGVELSIDDFETIRQRVPVICDLKPSGRYVTVDLHKAGGIPQVMKILLVNGLLHGDALTISGQTIAEILADIPDQPPSGQDVIRPFSNPVYKEGHLAILKGNLATEGAVAKISGVKTPVITGPARVFESEETCLEAILAGKIRLFTERFHRSKSRYGRGENRTQKY